MPSDCIVFFGASELGQRTLAAWPQDCPPVSYFVDNDARKWGRTVAAVPILAPETLRQEDRVFIVVTSVHYDEIAQQLEDMGFVEGEHFSPPQQALHQLPLSPGPEALLETRSDSTAIVAPINWVGWFQLDVQAVLTACAERGTRCILPPRPRRDRRVSLSLERSRFREVRRAGVPLYIASVYDICVTLGVTIERLDPANSAHWNAITDHMERCAAWVEVARRELDRAKPDAVLIPQGHYMVAAIYRYLAILRGLRVVAVENSLNGRRLMWDDISGVAVNKVAVRNHYWRWADLIDAGAAEAHVEWYLSSIKSLKQAQHQSPASAWTGPRRSGRTVLYLANVLTDSSVMFNSRVGSQTEAIKATARWALENDCTFVLKIHPRERPGHDKLFDGLTLNALQEDEAFWALTDSADCVIDHDNRYDTYGLIRQADACVTVCSQAGLEALMMGKETVLLGDAYYGGLGFTHEVHDTAGIPSAVKAALDRTPARVDAPRVAAFFYVLDRLYCVEKSAAGLAGLLDPHGERYLPLPVIDAAA